MKNNALQVVFTFLKKHRTYVAVLVLVLTIPWLLNFLFPLRVAVPYSCTITDRQGQVIHAFLSSDDKWRMQASLQEISPMLKRTILFKEDRWFYYHPGVNPLAIARAAFYNLIMRKRTSGASTITMQVARMLEPKQRTYIRKLIEMFRAFQLEWQYTKDEILQLYLNLVPYGGNIEGVKSASILYFGKNPDHLSLAEITALSIIPNRPASLRIGYNNDIILKERNRWLLKLKKGDLWNSTVIEDAMNEPLSVSRKAAPRIAPHLSILLKNKYPQSVIPTHIDLQMQRKTEKLVSDHINPLSFSGIHNAAVIVIENATGKIVTYVGSADFNNTTDGGQVNGAIAIRQPGSALKPLLYGLAIDAGLITPKSIMTDVPINIQGYQPENFDEKFYGYVTASYALENSLNIPAVKVLHQLGVQTAIQKLQQCHFKQIEKDANKLGLSLALGGCGVTLEEMAGLYATLANKGIFKSISHCVLDTFVDSTVILSKEATYMLTEILSKKARPDLPVNWEGSMHTPRIAWKTGTSYGKRDAWSIGFNRKYTVAVWVGNFSGAGVPELNGANIATPLLFKIFNTIDYNSPNDWFAMPANCGIRLICSETGKQPNHFCTNTVMDYYIPLVSPNDLCDNRKEYALDEKGKLSYCKQCQPEAGYRKKWYRVIEPEMQEYFETNRIPYEKIPPHNPECEAIALRNPPRITFPVNGTEYLIDENEPVPMQLSCVTTTDVQKVFWYVNNELVSSNKPTDKPNFTPPAGNVKISCTDDQGRNTDIRITVKYVRY